MVNPIVITGPKGTFEDMEWIGQRASDYADERYARSGGDGMSAYDEVSRDVVVDLARQHPGRPVETVQVAGGVL